MGSEEVLEYATVLNSVDGFHDLESKQDVIVEDFDEMMEDIGTGLIVARMVSDSVIKGMVSAVEQEAKEKIEAKELEIERLKGSLACLNGGQHRSTVDFERYAGLEDVRVKRDRMKESAIDEFKMLRKQIEGVKGCKIKRNGSCYEMVGLGGILKDEYDLGKTVDKLEDMMNDMSKLVDTALMFSKDSLSEWKQKHELKEKLEDMVIQSSINGIRDEFQKAENQNLLLAEKFSSISDLRNELESLRKLLPSSDTGHLISHGSLDIDLTHGNPLRSQLSSRFEENGESTMSKLADSYDASTLSHLNKEGLIKFFNNLIIDIKREHEAEVHQISDNYINLRRKYLSECERRSFLPPIKDFDVLKKKVPEVVAKLDHLLHDEVIGKDDKVVSLNSVLTENRQLRESVAVMKDEVNNLSSQLEASIVVSKNHELCIADTLLEASIVNDVYKCVIEEANCHIQGMKEESELEIAAMQDIYEVLLENTVICATEDLLIESLLKQELMEIVFQVTSSEFHQKLKNLHEIYITTSENLASLETKAVEMEAERIMVVEETERLRNEVNLLRNLMEEKEKLAKEEIDNLRKQETVMLKTRKDLGEMSEKLSKAEEKHLTDKMEMDSLNQRLAQAMEEIKTLKEYKKKALDLSQEKLRFMSLNEAKESEHRKQMEAIVVLVDELSADFRHSERRIAQDVESNYARLETCRSQLSSLITAANVLKNTETIYKQKFERKCIDLQTAEEEVDLLGDQVETFFGILEKIYIALDHYSPVLKHYPGVIEILKLVKRELSGEPLKGR